MKQKKIFKNVIFSTILTSTVFTLVGCDKKPDVSGVLTEEQIKIKNTIESRQAGYQDMGAAFKAISDEMKQGNMASTTVKFSAKAIQGYARDAKHWFPENSGNDSGFETEAKASIWENLSDFNQLQESLITEAVELVVVTNSEGGEGLPAQFKKTGGVCKQCHDKYREED
ncbi:MAG: c-type cytochrome [Cellvibrionaceae bacterium]